MADYRRRHYTEPEARKPVGPGGSSLIETGDGHADANRGGGGPRHQHSSVSPGPTGGAPATSGRAGGRARPRGALRETPPIPPLAPPADPVAVASELLSRAKSEIERLEDEKRSAEKELARVKAKIEAANALGSPSGGGWPERCRTPWVSRRGRTIRVERPG